MITLQAHNVAAEALQRPTSADAVHCKTSQPGRHSILQTYKGIVQVMTGLLLQETRDGPSAALSQQMESAAHAAVSLSGSIISSKSKAPYLLQHLLPFSSNPRVCDSLWTLEIAAAQTSYTAIKQSAVCHEHATASLQLLILPIAVAVTAGLACSLVQH